MDANKKYVTQISAQDLSEIAAIVNMYGGIGIEILKNGENVRIGLDPTELRRMAVSSVNGQTGAVTITAEGLGAALESELSDYALATHTHEGVYAALSHTHSEYVTTGTLASYVTLGTSQTITGLKTLAAAATSTTEGGQLDLQLGSDYSTRYGAAHIDAYANQMRLWVDGGNVDSASPFVYINRGSSAGYTYVRTQSDYFDVYNSASGGSASLRMTNRTGSTYKTCRFDYSSDTYLSLSGIYGIRTTSGTLGAANVNQMRFETYCESPSGARSGGLYFYTDHVTLEAYGDAATSNDFGIQCYGKKGNAAGYVKLIKENPSDPSIDSLYLATHGWANGRFWKNGSSSASLQNAEGNAVLNFSAKTSSATSYKTSSLYLSTDNYTVLTGSNALRLRSNNDSTNATRIEGLSYDYASLLGRIEFSPSGVNITAKPWGGDSFGITVSNGNGVSGGGRLSLSNSPDDSTDEDSLVVPTIGWTTSHFIEKDDSATGYLRCDSGTVTFHTLSSDKWVKTDSDGKLTTTTDLVAKFASAPATGKPVVTSGADGTLVEATATSETITVVTGISWNGLKIVAEKKQLKFTNGILETATATTADEIETVVFTGLS